MTRPDLSRGAAPIGDPAPSVAHLFRERVRATPEREAFRFPVGEGWEAVNWRTVGDRVDRIAAGLLSLGIEREDRVAIASATRYEWVLADLGILCAGGATTTVYPTTGGQDVRFILADSGTRVLFAEDDTQIEKVRAVRDELPELSTVVTFDGTADGDWVISLADLERRGERHLTEQADAVERAVAALGAESLATLIYTSGTTGTPKGVRLVHGCWTYEGAAVASLGILDIDDLQYLWLPLAHVFGKVLLATQFAIGFASAVDGRVDKLVDNLAVVRPTFMGAAPRIFEKVHARVVTMAHDEGGPKAKIFDWAFGVGIEVSRQRQRGREPGGLLKLRHQLADRLVFTKLRQRFGGRIRYFVSGSAALNRDIAEWFDAAGLRILEGYGLTETSGGSTVNRPDANRIGTVGPPLPGTEVRIADDGEVLLRGPGVMRGYHNRPDLTAEVLTDDGWFHTGDIGEFSDGFVRITDRKKDLIKTSGGKYVAPQMVEAQFKALCPYAAELVVHGEERNFISALVTLDREAMAGWAEQHGLGGRSHREIVTSPQAREMVQGYVDELNARLNRWETIKKFTVLPDELTVEAGDLTPSLKLRRKAVEEKYRDVLNSMYTS
ncbi:long-chain acyl-CoA synthetase [Prauserella shujinwangii]|uniref:Long-chain acyl-CoA synthetase n=1 Tax=Prauserella shujinwangii TaxID=1453103 RepID=A0A2T0LYZ6_9PSEU|nr:long-chain fatty acid--CoA ligase [Prauserella shujinwangii]PRX49337.1 long-chain acyl-CoA synthetase [Prauserella shujinwangii]